LIPDDPKNDPVSPQRGDCKDLFEPKGPLISVPLALDIVVPEPKMLGPIQPFNATTSLALDVCHLDETGRQNKTGKNIPQPPTVPLLASDIQRSCLPDYRCAVGGADMAQAWKRVHDKWIGSQGTREKAIESWVKFFVWEAAKLDSTVPSTMAGHLADYAEATPFVGL
jgi:hypothetical protein